MAVVGPNTGTSGTGTSGATMLGQLTTGGPTLAAGFRERLSGDEACSVRAGYPASPFPASRIRCGIL